MASTESTGESARKPLSSSPTNTTPSTNQTVNLENAQSSTTVNPQRPINWQKAFLLPTQVQVLSSQPIPGAHDSSNPLHLIELTDGSRKFYIRTLLAYPTGADLTIQNNGRNGIHITKQPNPIPQLLGQLQSLLIKAADQLTPLPSLSKEIEFAVENILRAPNKNRSKAFTESIQRFTKLTSTATKIFNLSILQTSTLSVQQIERAIVRSGLYHESNLSVDTKAPPQQNQHSLVTQDYKSQIKTLLKASIELLKHFPPEPNTGSNPGKPPTTANSPLSSHTLPSHTLLAQTLQTLNSANGPEQTQRRFYSMIQNLLLNVNSHIDSNHKVSETQMLNHILGISAFISFLSKLSPTPPAPNTIQHTGWGSLFTLLFGSPKVLSRKKTNSSISPRNTLEGLISQLQSQLFKISAKQLALLNQQETAQKKTIYQDEIFFGQGEHIYQIPIKITEQESKKPTQATSERSWQIEMGFDLGHLGLMRSIAMYQKGKLKLTFQIQSPSTKKIFSEKIHLLTKPFAKWGIELDSVKYEPYPEKKDEADEAPFDNFINITL